MLRRITDPQLRQHKLERIEYWLQEQPQAVCDAFGINLEDVPPMLEQFLAEAPSGGPAMDEGNHINGSDLYKGASTDETAPTAFTTDSQFEANFDQGDCFLEYNDLVTMSAVSRSHFQLAAAWPPWKHGSDHEDSTDYQSE